MSQNTVFWWLHVIALFFFFPALFVTIPWHISWKQKEKQNRQNNQDK